MTNTTSISGVLDNEAASASEVNGASKVRKFEKLRAALADKPLSGDGLCQQFFFEMDYQADPENVVHSLAIPVAVARRRQKSVRDFSAYLAKRVMQRALAVGSGKPLPKFAAYHDTVALREVSTMLWALLERYFASYNAMEEAFEKFANGNLRVPMEDGTFECESDSGYYFLFAELAIVCIEQGQDDDFWEYLLNALVRTQKIYIQVYEPSGPRKRQRNIFQKYRSANYKQSLPKTHILKIQADYKGLKTAQLIQKAGENAAWALTGNPPKGKKK